MDFAPAKLVAVPADAVLTLRRTAKMKSGWSGVEKTEDVTPLIEDQARIDQLLKQFGHAPTVRP